MKASQLLFVIYDQKALPMSLCGSFHFFLFPRHISLGGKWKEDREGSPLADLALYRDRASVASSCCGKPLFVGCSGRLAGGLLWGGRKAPR